MLSSQTQHIVVPLRCCASWNLASGRVVFAVILGQRWVFFLSADGEIQLVKPEPRLEDKYTHASQHSASVHIPPHTPTRSHTQRKHAEASLAVVDWTFFFGVTVAFLPEVTWWCFFYASLQLHSGLWPLQSDKHKCLPLVEQKRNYTLPRHTVWCSQLSCACE